MSKEQNAPLLSATGPRSLYASIYVCVGEGGWEGSRVPGKIPATVFCAFENAYEVSGGESEKEREREKG